MTGWQVIEEGFSAALAVMPDGGTPVLATVRCVTPRDRRSLLAAIGRERLPAAYVMVSGRDASDKTYRRAGSGLVSVWLAARSGRSDEEARRGGADVTGAFTLAEQTLACLHDLAVGSNQRVCFIDEQPISGEDGTVVWEQRYEVRTTTGMRDPTFGGMTLVGPLSEVQVDVGDLVTAVSSFSIPGIDGVFQRAVGTRERPIHWRGQLRAENHWVLGEIEAGIEEVLRQGRVDNVIDSWGRTHVGCVMRAFRRQGPQRRDAVSGMELQDFEIEFIQLNED